MKCVPRCAFPVIYAASIVTVALARFLRRDGVNSPTSHSHRDQPVTNLPHNNASVGTSCDTNFSLRTRSSSDSRSRRRGSVPWARRALPRRMPGRSALEPSRRPEGTNKVASRARLPAVHGYRRGPRRGCRHSTPMPRRCSSSLPRASAARARHAGRRH